MMKRRHLFKWSLSVGMFLLCSMTMLAQKTITGQMTDASTDEPLIGANVIVKGTTTGTITDFDGNYSIEASEGDVLIFSYTGYSSQEVSVGSESTINIGLESGQVLDEVVVVAYGKQKKVTVTGAVVGVEGEELKQSPAVDISNSLAGRLPGLVVIQTGGEPGYDGANISIRGTNTLGNSSPLIVIDGIPDRAGGLGRLSPQDIESISVLKDASAAIYGARAANGAILITTKRGKTGKPSITFDFNQGWSTPTVVPNMSSAVEYATIMNELPIYQTIPVNEWGAAWDAIQTTGTYDSPTAGVGTINANYSPEAVRKHGTGEDPWGFPDTDWFGDALKPWSPQSRYNMQINGGTENIRYLASLGYINQDAIYHESATFYKQYNFRVNLDAKVNDYISADLGLAARREDRNFPTQSAGSIFRMLMRGRPTEPEVWPNGLPGPDIENGQNPYVITTNATGYQENPRDYIQVNGGITLTNPWVEGLKLTLNGSVDTRSETNKRWETPWILYSWDRVSYEADGVTPKLTGNIRSNFSDPRLSEGYSKELNTNLTALLSYERKFGDNSLNILAGVTRETFQGSGFFAFRRNYISAAVDQLFAGGSLQQNTGGSGYERARLGYYGRVQYDFREKYLAEFIWRYDGSYIFPEDSRFGFFPGLLLGWNVSNEDFFNVSFVDYLKLRGSYGEMGNDQVFFGNQLQEYAYLSTYGFGEYPIDGQVVTTLRETVLANPDFTWERAKNWNFGLDATLFNNKIDFTFEYFYNRRDQILIQLTGSTPSSSGINSLLPPVNAGKVDNKGYEFALGYNGQAGSGLQFRAGINGGYAQNEVVFMDEIPGAPDYQRQEGKPIGSFLVYQYDGVFLDQAAIDANTIDYSQVTGQLIPGDMKFVDTDGNGVIDADDRIRLNESITPTFNFGATVDLAYKNFDLSILLQGATGASTFVRTESGDIGNYLNYQYENRWRIDAPSSIHPRLASRNDTYFTGSFGGNTYYLFDKDYIRVKNIELGYNLPRTTLDKINLGSLRLYVNALNLFTIAGELGSEIFDPETVNQSGQYYPQTKVINTGVSLTF
ncbi:SusC/RagA family TonB-linked outer membrane protein [Flavilitoribacter nigricans]|uniref:SusC/RagA family TonB-linked outer membrane protein n=1 Tax=Flavilitoribacter nigricans (strain ATCC 23147 / DSM 23189 / NBRC 102662 / NCIMB 1420 / SS-2) TaxID=1122177 RepID=A0A2D0MYU3_FLAN2|nr:TonB-dependent receptor [Flavilitoribacter nigricans]PHN01462.1 SusC/RagA family TonB-linked outer membrane protein [Flavilitoribacter nigricans DSM 23189 = NBRC 102662]